MVILRLLPVTFALLFHAPSAASSRTGGATIESGTYVAKSLNHKSLPAEERVSSTDGYSHWVKIERLILRLQADGRFTVSMKYYHEHLHPKERPAAAQLLDAANRGTFVVHGNEIIFSPTSKGGRAPKPVSGELHGDQIEVRFRVREGDHWRPMTFVAVRDRSYW
jgi:hypothetical protein